MDFSIQLLSVLSFLAGSLPRSAVVFAAASALGAHYLALCEVKSSITWNRKAS